MMKLWTVRITASLTTLLALFALMPVARADIFQWEYISPANPNLGKQQSATLAPGGAGVNAVPAANLSNRNLTKAYLIGANLSGALAGSSNLTNAELSHANLANASFTGETVDDYVIGIRSNLNGANLSDANLTNVSLGMSTLINANLSQANLTNAYLAGNYVVYGGDEGGVSYFPGTDLTNANLSGANLTNANASGSCYLFDCALGANFYGANLTGADARGANFYYAILAGSNTSNLIQSDGHIAGLDLTGGASLTVRDYENYANVGVPIVVDHHLALDATGTLRLVFDADPWDSTISFAPGSPVALGGTLELAFAPGVDAATQTGRTIDLFDWTGVTPTGAFTISSPYTWNLSKLYTTGEITLAAVIAIPGDYNGNGTVGPEDYNLWKASFGSTTNLAADGNGNHVIDAADYSVWRDHLGQTVGSGSTGYPLGASLESLSAGVPEPAGFILAAIGLASVAMFKRS